ncbi:hypothetical protein A9Q99_17385 [Gammaproteobacteria bacterium 45_16_T64]|nr:hypothetical protein A9Q99_17385 [Gammaproteobacteria bacterium 45_16_T64]
MSTVTELLSDTTVKLDARSREAVSEINEIIDSAGNMPILLAIADFFSWAEKGMAGPLNVATADWLGFAKAMNGIAIIRLKKIHDLAYIEEMRFTMNDGGGQREFWANVRKAAYKAMMGKV